MRKFLAGVLCCLILVIGYNTYLDRDSFIQGDFTAAEYEAIIVGQDKVLHHLAERLELCEEQVRLLDETSLSYNTSRNASKLASALLKEGIPPPLLVQDLDVTKAIDEIPVKGTGIPGWFKWGLGVAVILFGVVVYFLRKYGKRPRDGL